MCRNIFVEAVKSKYEIAKVFEKRRARPYKLGTNVFTPKKIIVGFDVPAQKTST